MKVGGTSRQVVRWRLVKRAIKCTRGMTALPCPVFPKLLTFAVCRVHQIQLDGCSIQYVYFPRSRSPIPLPWRAQLQHDCQCTCRLHQQPHAACPIGCTIQRLVPQHSSTVLPDLAKLMSHNRLLLRSIAALAFMVLI